MGPRYLLIAIGLLASASMAPAESPSLFQPDPLSIQRYEKGYRYPQAGWIVLHIEGEPYERGFQHGRLLAPEIVATMTAFAAEQSHRDPQAGWRQTRTLANALFLRKFDPEYLEEIKGIADRRLVGRGEVRRSSGRCHRRCNPKLLGGIDDAARGSRSPPDRIGGQGVPALTPARCRHRKKDIAAHSRRQGPPRPTAQSYSVTSRCSA